MKLSSLGLVVESFRAHGESRIFMIRFLVAPGHHYTFKGIMDPAKRVRPLPVQVWFYNNLFAAEALPAGIWVFCDIERLASWELRLAGEIARAMREAGPSFRILNDPARAAARYELLLRLHQQGYNGFRAWRAEDGVPPARFPVFMRLEADHKWPLTGLIDSAEALAAELETLRMLGIARRGVLIIEYAADELLPGVFRKFGAYRFGDRIVADHLVHDVSWLAKYGHPDAWSDERYVEEAAYVRDNPHAEALMRAFEIGGIEYGRADYGIVGGVPQIWEINTNPVLPGGAAEKTPPRRVEATQTARDNRLAAIEALDTVTAGDPVMLDSDILIKYRERLKTQELRDRD